MRSRPLRLALQLGLFQLSLGILGILILGLLNRLLIQDIQLTAVLAGLERLSLVTPLLLLGLGVVLVFGVERRTTGLMLPAGPVPPDVSQRLALLQMVCFLGAALMTRRLDVVGFRNTVKTRFADVMEMAVD